jgi:flagellar biosynthetic protein FliR
VIAIDSGYYPQALLMVLARVGGVIGILQYFGGAKVPVVFKTFLALVVSVAIMPMVPAAWLADARLLSDLPGMLFAIVQEVAIGACMGLVCQLVIAATSVAGVLIGMGSSLMMARSIDPSSGQQVGLPQQLLTTLFVLFLLLTNVHLEAIRLLGVSFSTLPMLASWDINSIARMVVGLGSMCFDWGLRLAMPVFCTALVLDSCLGLIAKLAPDFNVLFLSMPVRLFAGLSVLGLTIRVGAAGVFEHMREQMLQSFGRLLGG